MKMRAPKEISICLDFICIFIDSENNLKIVSLSSESSTFQMMNTTVEIQFIVSSTVVFYIHFLFFAEFTVLYISIVIVIGPTPPGTGVIFDAFSEAVSNSTSPTSR